MKKIKYLLFFLLFSIMGVNYVDAASLSLSANKSTVVVGNTVTVTVSASGAAGWEYCLSYDSSIFELTSTNSDTGGACVLTGSTLIGYSKVTFTLKAKKSGSSTVTLKSNNMYDDYGKEISHSKGSVTLTTKTQAEIEASYSTNADLKSLSIDGYDLTPEFSKNTLKYSLEVENEVEKITIKAGKADSKASINGTGEKLLTEGVNKFEIVVTAEKGNKKTYEIEVTRKELNPIFVKVEGEELTLVRKSDALTAPTYYSSTEIEIEGEEIPAFKSDITGYVLVGLKDEEGNISLYRYDETSGEYVLYQQLSTESITLIPLKVEKSIEEYSLIKEVTIGNEKVTGYTSKNDKDFVLVYGMNASTGDIGWYKYDTKDGTLQRYVINEGEVSEDKFDLYFILTISFASLSLITIILVIVLLSMNSKLRKKNNKLIDMIESTKSDDEEEVVDTNEDENKIENKEEIKTEEIEGKIEDKEEIKEEQLSKREQRRLEKQKELEQQEELRKMQEDFLKTEANEIIVDDVELEESAPVRKRRRKKK